MRAQANTLPLLGLSSATKEVFAFPHSSQSLAQHLQKKPIGIPASVMKTTPLWKFTTISLLVAALFTWQQCLGQETVAIAPTIVCQPVSRRMILHSNAAYNPTSGEDLTPAQMAGDRALLNGARGKRAGQIAKYDSTTTTDGKWVERSSEKKTADNPTGDITLPPKGSDSITIWFRLEGKDVADVAVGLDSVTIEDLGKVEPGTNGQPQFGESKPNQRPPEHDK